MSSSQAKLPIKSSCDIASRHYYCKHDGQKNSNHRSDCDRPFNSTCPSDWLLVDMWVITHLASIILHHHQISRTTVNHHYSHVPYTYLSLSSNNQPIYRYLIISSSSSSHYLTYLHIVVAVIIIIIIIISPAYLYFASCLVCGSPRLTSHSPPVIKMDWIGSRSSLLPVSNPV